VELNGRSEIRLDGARASKHGTNRMVKGVGEHGEAMVSAAARKEAVVPEFPSVTHVALTVTDLGRSRPWYQKLFGAQPVIDEDTGPFHHVVWLLGSQTLVGIHQFPDPHGSEPFDERQPGLDHLAFACANRAELEQWESKLNELGIENGGIVDASYGSGLSFRDPDNIALEFFAPPG
jgi:glyoxylase I family protein